MAKPRKKPNISIPFTPPMECLPVARIPEGDIWIYEILCGGSHKISYVALEVMLRNG
jgi:hypothetical protein